MAVIYTREDALPYSSLKGPIKRPLTFSIYAPRARTRVLFSLSKALYGGLEALGFSRERLIGIPCAMRLTLRFPLFLIFFGGGLYCTGAESMLSCSPRNWVNRVYGAGILRAYILQL